MWHGAACGLHVLEREVGAGRVWRHGMAQRGVWTAYVEDVGHSVVLER